MTARRIVAALLLLVASLLAPFAVGARWAESTITDSEQFAETVGPLAEDPLVQQAIEGAVSEAIIDAIGIEDRLAGLGFLPDPISEAVASGVNSAVENRVGRYVQSDDFAELWVSLAGGVQEQLMVLLERSGSGAVQVQEGTLVLDTAVVADLLKAELDELDLSLTEEFDPDLIGQEIVLAETPNLQIAADALRIFLPVATWLWIVVVAMFLGGVLLWQPRSRGTLWAGLGLFLGGGLTWVLLDVGSAQVVESAPDPNLRALMRSTIDILVQFLANALLVMMALGLVLLLGGWLAGGTRSGKKIRDRIAEAAHGWGAPLSDSPIGRFTSEHPMFVPTLRAVVLTGALVFLLTADRLAPVTIVWTFVITAGLLMVVEVVEGAGLLRERAHAGAVMAEAAHPAAPAGAAPAAGPGSATGSGGSAPQG
jgi:hypothetical protein